MVNRVIDINHQLLGNKTSGFKIETLKTKSSYRQIPMSETVFCALQNILSRPRSTKFVVDGYGNFVFFNEDGVPRNTKSYRGALERIAKKICRNQWDSIAANIVSYLQTYILYEYGK